MISSSSRSLKRGFMNRPSVRWTRWVDTSKSPSYGLASGATRAGAGPCHGILIAVIDRYPPGPLGGEGGGGMEESPARSLPAPPRAESLICSPHAPPVAIDRFLLFYRPSHLRSIGATSIGPPPPRRKLITDFTPSFDFLPAPPRFPRSNDPRGTLLFPPRAYATIGVCLPSLAALRACEQLSH